MHEKLLKEPDTALSAFCVLWTRLKVVFFPELHHVSCLTLLALADTKWHTLGRGPSWLIRHAVTYTLPLKGAQLNDPRGQKKNKGIAGRVKPLLPPEAKPTIFTVFGKTRNRADVFPLKKDTLLLIGVDHHHPWHSFLLLQKEGFSCYFSAILKLIFSSNTSCGPSSADQWSPGSAGAVWRCFQP